MSVSVLYNGMCYTSIALSHALFLEQALITLLYVSKSGLTPAFLIAASSASALLMLLC
jgi:hypothetical protein